MSIVKLRNKIIKGHVLDVLRKLPDECIDTVITSPPYWGLRFYGTTFKIWGGDLDCEHKWEHYTQKGQTGGTKSPKVQLQKRKGRENFQAFEDTNPAFCTECDAWLGELGNEPNFDLFVSHLIGIFDEIKRVLKPHGTIWVNLGDTYSSKPVGRFSGGGISMRTEGHVTSGNIDKTKSGVREKSMCMVPERFAMEMIRSDWILRNKITWHKPNAMPESVQDRLSRKTEEIFLFTKEKKNFFDLDSVRKPLKPATIDREKYTRVPQSGKYFEDMENPNVQAYLGDKRSLEKGANPGNIIEDDTLTQNNEIITMFSKEKKYFFDLESVKIKSKTYEDDPRCRTEEPIQYNGKSPQTSKHIKSPEKTNPGNVLTHHKQFWKEPQSSLRDPTKKGRMGNLGAKGFEKLLNQVQNYDERIRSHELLTDSEKKHAIIELDKVANLMQLGKIIDFRMNFRGDKKIKKSRDKNLEDDGFYFVFVHRKKNPGDIITGLMDIENTYDHPVVKSYSSLIFALYEELQTVLKKGIDIGTFWSINTQSLADAHFATFPTTLLETPIKAGCPKFVCKSCGKPKEWDCGCGVGYRRGIVLDPFMGSGTTGLVARRLGRDYLGIELQEEYIKIALKRISSDKEGRTHKLGGLIKK